MTQPYILTKSAADDLGSIVRYTVNRWGEAQCRDYIAQIEKESLERYLSMIN